MKIKEGFILREVCNSFVVVPFGAATVDFNCMITLNETGAFLWRNLAEESTKEELIQKLMNSYEVDSATADKDVTAFLTKMEEAYFLE